MNKAGTRSSAVAARWLISGPPLLYLLFFFAIPALIMVFASFRFAGEYGGLAPLQDDAGKFDLTLENYTRFSSDFVYTAIFIKSLLYALATTLACLVMAYPLAMTIARSPKKFRDLLVLLVILPFWSNFLIRVYAWMIILGPQSALTRALNALLAIVGIEPVTLIYSAFAVIVGLVYVHLPFMVLPLYANLEKHDPALLDAAQDLGANVWQTFCRVACGLRIPVCAAGDRRRIFVQRFQTQRRMGRVHLRLVPQAVSQRRDAGSGRQFADHRTDYQRGIDRARHHGRLRDVSL